MVTAVFARLKQLLIEKSWPKLSTGFKNQAGTILGACSAVFRLRRYLQTTTIELRSGATYPFAPLLFFFCMH
jgi:hypothetical protein